jgi:hypothetical protein
MKSLDEIKSNLVNGDLVKVARALNMTPDNVRMTLKRPTAKRHKEVLKVAGEIAEFNQNLKVYLQV